MKHIPSVLFALTAVAAMACSKESDRPRTDTGADNTTVNQRDRSGVTMTPGDQGESEADRDVTAQIRRAVMADDQLGTNAKNVKIITRGGTVTLRGPVSSAAERARVEELAKRVTGVQSVNDQIEVASSK